MVCQVRRSRFDQRIKNMSTSMDPYEPSMEPSLIPDKSGLQNQMMKTRRNFRKRRFSSRNLKINLKEKEVPSSSIFRRCSRTAE